MHYLVATDSVHSTAAACDHLEGRVAPADAVTVAGLADLGTRDAGDATNVATARLGGRVDLETTSIDADADRHPAVAVLDAAADRDVDAVILDARLAGSTDDRVSEAVTRIIGRAPVPVVVVPRSREA